MIATENYAGSTEIELSRTNINKIQGFLFVHHWISRQANFKRLLPESILLEDRRRGRKNEATGDLFFFFLVRLNLFSYF